MPRERADRNAVATPADAALMVLRRLADLDGTREGLQSFFGAWIGESLPVAAVRFDWTKEEGRKEIGRAHV